MAVRKSFSFGFMLKRYRTASRLTQEELSSRAGISVHAISDLERGVYLSPHQSTVNLLASALTLSDGERATLLEAARSGRGDRFPAPSAEEVLLSGVQRPLVGRHEEAAEIGRHISGTGPPLLLLEGEPGIGKTRLLLEAVRIAEDRKLTVLSGGCDRRSGQDPYTPMTQALQQYALRIAKSELRAATRGANWLVRLLPELHGAVSAPVLMGSLGAEQERRLVFDSVTRFLGNSAASGGMLLVLDDLQWAGEDAVDLLYTVLKSAGDIHLRALGAYRATEVDPTDTLSSALADLAGAGLAAVLPVRELDPKDAEDLLSALIPPEHDVDDETRQDVIRRSDGVPFFLVSYAEGLRSGAHRGEGAARLPWSLTQSIRQRIASLPPETQDLISAMAVIGRRAPTSILARLVDRPEDTVLSSLNTAWRAGIVEEGPGRTHQFSHDAIRDVVETDLEAPRRMLLHRRAAEALQRLPDRHQERTPGALASHFVRGDQVERALPYLLAAGDRAESVFAHREAEQYFQTALDLAESIVSPDAAADASARLGLVLAEAGRRSEARRLLTRAVDSYRDFGDLEGEARTAAWLTGVLETPREGIERITMLHERMHGRPPSHGQARLQEVLAYLLGLAGDHQNALVAAARASELARELGDQRLLWRSENHRGQALIELGTVREGLEVLDAVAAQARSAGDINEVTALDHAAVGYLAAGSLDRTRDYLERALRLVEAYSSPLGVAHALGQMSIFLAFVCEWADLNDCLARLNAILESVNLQWERPLALALLATAQRSISEGDFPEAIQNLEDSGAAFDRAGEAGMRAAVIYSLAELDLLTGNHDAARDRLQRALDDPSTSPKDMTALLPLRAWADLLSGSVEAARQAALQAVELARTQGADLYLADGLSVLGLAEARLGDQCKSAVTLEEGGVVARRLSYARGQGRGLYASGLALAGQGRTEEARGHLNAALAVFEKLRLEPYVAMVQRALSDLGQSRPGRSHQVK